MRQAAPLFSLPAIVATTVLCVASPAVHAATAEASISNVKVTLVALDAEPWITGAWPWIVQNTAQGWPAVAESTGVTADLAGSAQHGESNGWIGTNRNVALGSADGSASASVSFSGADLFSAGAASSFASASNGDAAWSSARLWDAAFMVGGRTRVVVTMTVDGLSAVGNGGTAMALATVGLWGAGLDTGFVNAQAQVIDSPDFSVTYDGPYTLSVNWDNASRDMVVANISLLTSAQAIAAVPPAPVPEPASALLLGLGLATLAARRRRAGR